MKFLGKYKNGNYWYVLFSDGTKVRYNDKASFDPVRPESIDLKVTNRCFMGCPMCHENSTPDGTHGDILNLPFIDTMFPYSEVACLSGDTIVHSENGSIEIEKLKVGDKIYDSDHILRTITKIQTSNKKPIKITGKKGVNVICSEDHPFISDGIQVIAKDMLDKKIDNLTLYNCESNKKYIIDMAKHIHPKNVSIDHSRGGKLFDNNTVRLRNSTKPIPRYISLSNDLMWLYGLFVAEGSNKGIVLNINETDYANKAIKIWKDVFGFDSRIYENKERHSIAIEFETTSLIEDLFVNEMKVGVGARNKSFKYLYNIDNKEMVRQALIGLYNGDGCIRERGNKFDGKNYCTSLKTTSKYLAYDVSYLLAKWFGIYATVYHGISPKRKIEDRILDESDYYSVEFYGYDNCMKIFYDQFEYQKPMHRQHRPKSYSKVSKIEDAEQCVLYDITLDGGSHIFPINGYLLTHNCGGGNPLLHPDLVPFLEKLKERKIIANMTVNQIDFMENIDSLKNLVDNKLVYGLGVSLVRPESAFINALKQFPNAVIHIINGLVTMDQLNELSNNDFKILILGYKEFRRGKDLYGKDGNHIENLKSQLYDKLPEIVNDGWFNCVSFDNLAIKQLEPKRFMSDDEYDEFYMGDDGKYTFYCDAVNKEFAKSSTSIVRYPLMDNVTDMFNIIRKENNG